jgi:hypothetical protein
MLYYVSLVLFYMYSDGLGVRVDDSHQGDLGQYLFGMVGIIHQWERPKYFPVMVGNFPQGERKRLYA